MQFCWTSLSTVFTNQITAAGPPTHLFPGESSTYEPEELKKLLSELEKSNQGVTEEEQLSDQRKETPLPVQRCTCVAKTRILKGRPPILSIFRGHFVPLLPRSTTDFYVTAALAWQRSPCCLRSDHFGLFFPTLHAGLAASCKIKMPPGTKMEILEKWPMQDFKRPFSPQGGTCLPSRGCTKHIQRQLSLFQSFWLLYRKVPALGAHWGWFSWTDNTLMSFLMHIQNVSRTTQRIY